MMNGRTTDKVCSEEGNRGFHNHETGRKPRITFSKKIGNQNNQEATTSIVASKVEFWFQFSTVSKGFTKLLKKWWTAARPIKFVVRRAIRGFHNHGNGKKAPDYIFSKKIGNQNNQEATTSIVASKVEFWFQFSAVSKGFTKLLKNDERPHDR